MVQKHLAFSTFTYDHKLRKAKVCYFASWTNRTTGRITQDEITPSISYQNRKKLNKGKVSEVLQIHKVMNIASIGLR